MPHGGRKSKECGRQHSHHDGRAYAVRPGRDDPPPAGRAAFDECEVLQLFDLPAVEDQLDRRRTRRGAKVVRAILAEHYVGLTLTQSELEEAMLVMSRGVGLPNLEVNSGST